MSTAMQVRLRHWPGMKVSWLGAGAVVHSGEEPSPGSAALVVSPHGSAECAVVISSHTVKLQPAMIEELAEVLANGLPRGFTAMRFVAWDGACATNERPAAAHMIAMRLGIDVIAAAGPLLGVPGGSLFAPVGRGEHRPGGFWRFRTGVQPVRVGWRFPAPAWESDLCTEIPELPGDLVLDQIPAGLWLHRRRVGSVTDLAYSVPTDHANPALILGHPSDQPLHRDELAQAVSSVPTLAADRCVFTPYGQNPIADGPVGPVVADVLGRAVHVRTGLPLCAPAGQRAVVTIDAKGLPRWRTFARELWHAPRTGAPRPVDWVNPCPDVLDTPAGQATFSLGSGWVLEVVQAGLWIRPEHLSDPADWIRGLPVDVNRCAVIVGAPNAAEAPPPTHTIAEVLERLPIDARKRAYLTVPRGTTPNIFMLATELRDALPEPGEVELVAPSASAATTTTGSFPAVQDAPRHASHSADGRHGDANGPYLVDGRHGDANGPYLVDGRPANGHPSGAHPTVSRPATYESGYDKRGIEDSRGYETRPDYGAAAHGGYTEPRTSSFDAPRPNGFDDRAPRTGALPAVDPTTHAFDTPRTNGFDDRTPRTGAFPAADPTNGFDGRGQRTGSFPAQADPAAAAFAPPTPNGTQRPPRPGGYPAEPPMQQPRPRPADATGAFPAAGGLRNNPDSTTPMVPVVPGPNPNGGNGNGHGGNVHGGPNGRGGNGHGPGVANGHGGSGHGGSGHGATGHAAVYNGFSGPGHNGNGHNGAPGVNGHPGAAPNGHGGPVPNGHGGPVPNGHGGPVPNGHGGPVPNGHGPSGLNGNGHPGPVHNGNGYGGMHPDLHVAPPHAFHREDRPLPTPGPNAPHGYSFDAPDYDEHHFDPVTSPSRHHEEPSGRMTAQRPSVEEQNELAEETSSINTGREIRSHNKKGKTSRADDKTSTQELDRLLGFFDEIRRAKAWDEDPNSPEAQAAKRAAAGQPPAGPRRARH
ncbi:hypothetical protein [Dactylosporangium sp. NPDC051484]|uniref:hypothetical protein n=1 Tax=Dactylosporangium sp. NPDC051484 TaxID=3154942 RepID=UPI00344DB2E6